jgi:hypothetical protein
MDVKQLEVCLKFYQDAIESGEITRGELDALPSAGGLFTPHGFEAINYIKEASPTQYRDRLASMVHVLRAAFPRIEG